MLEISLLGEIIIQSPGKPVIHIGSQKELALLAYLAHTGQTANRETLADLLWEARSTSQSLSNLRTTLARLRKQVGDNFIVTRKTVALTPPVHEQTDTVRFQAFVAAGEGERSVTAVKRLKQGLDLYRAEMLAGFYLPNAPRFNEWLIIEQERLHQTAMRGFRQLAGWQGEQGDYSAGVATAQRWIAFDPLDETAQQQLMRLLAYDGRASEALAVYEKCRHLLETELGMPPAPATTALYEAVLAGSLLPPDTTPPPLHNLPRPLTTLFGRKKEIEALNGRLLTPDYPLIAITGPGGIGKTSLALAAARVLAEARHPFKDGIWFVSLEVVEEGGPAEVRNQVAALAGQAMGLYFHGEKDLWSQLTGHLSGKNLLLILDNVEQFLLTAADLALDLLAAGPGLQLLVTSRATLPLAASFSFPLSGLETPTGATAEALQNESVRLFAERAARLPSPFRLEKQLAQVVEICRFVEGMPLAIELAAASLGRLMIDEIMPALSGNLQLLETTRRDLPARHRTLQAVFDYTWQLLDRREQILLTQITVFRGGFTRQAAEAVIDDRTAAIYKLQDHALLNRNETGRFRIHPLLRQLAQEKLNQPDMAAVAQQALNRHAVYFTTLAQSFEKALQYGETHEAVQTLLKEQTNLRAAWHYAVQTGQWQLIANGLDSVSYFYRRQGFFSEATAQIETAVSALQEQLSQDDVPLTSLLCRLLTARAFIYHSLAEFDQGMKTAEQALQLAQKLADPGLEADARHALAKLHYRDHVQTIAQYEQVVALAQASGNSILEAEARSGIGSHQIWQGDLEQADQALHKALELCRALQYKPGEMMTLIRLGRLLTSREAYTETVPLEEQALQLSRQLDDIVAEALILSNMGVNFSLLGDLVASQRYQEKALAIYHRLNMPGQEQTNLGSLGALATRLGDYATAEKHLNEAMTLAEQVKDQFWQAWVKLNLADMWNERGQLEKALPLITAAYETAEQLHYLNFKAGVLFAWGSILLNQGDWPKAEEKFQTAYDLRQGSGRTEQALPSLAGLAYAAFRQGKLETAADLAEQLWQSWQAAPAIAERASLKVYWWLGTIWDGLGDTKAKNLWEKAQTLLHEQSKKILNEDGQKKFLEQVPAHRAILRVQV